MRKEENKKKKKRVRFKPESDLKKQSNIAYVSDNNLYNILVYLLLA